MVYNVPQTPVCLRSSVTLDLAEPSLQLYQENAGYAPLYEAAGPPQIQMGTARNAGRRGALDLSVPERLRRLAGRYIDNQDSTVSGVHLESGPSGRFQVVITIDIGDVLGDTTNSEFIGYSCQPTSHRDRPRVSFAYLSNRPSRGRVYDQDLALCYAFEIAMIIVWIASIEALK